MQHPDSLTLKTFVYAVTIAEIHASLNTPIPAYSWKLTPQKQEQKFLLNFSLPAYALALLALMQMICRAFHVINLFLGVVGCSLSKD